MQITCEFSLVDDASELVVSNLVYTDTGFTVANTVTTWNISNVQAKCDLIALDNGLK